MEPAGGGGGGLFAHSFIHSIVNLESVLLIFTDCFENLLNAEK